MKILKKTVLLFAAALAAVAPMQAQLLWRVEGKDAKGATYLFGTHHVAPTALLDSVPGFDNAFADADVVYGEVDMAQMADQAAVQQAMMPYAMAPADSTLSRVLTPAQMDSLSSILGKYSGGMLSAGMFEPLKPALITTQLAMLQNMNIFPEFNPAEQLDGTIQARAHAAGKNVKGLETVEQQFAMLMGGSIAGQARSLMEQIREEDKAIDLVKRLADAYMQQNLSEIQTIMSDPLSMDDESAERLINARNRNWVTILAEEMPENRLFVAVGAGHLPGENGLIQLLRNAGYTVTPVDGR